MKRYKTAQNLYRSLQRRGELGATWISKRGKSLICIAVTDRLHDNFKEYLDTCIHEWLHSRFPDLSEFEIRRMTFDYLSEKGLNTPGMPSVLTGERN